MVGIIYHLVEIGLNDLTKSTGGGPDTPGSYSPVLIMKKTYCVDKQYIEPSEPGGFSPSHIFERTQTKQTKCMALDYYSPSGFQIFLRS